MVLRAVVTSEQLSLATRAPLRTTLRTERTPRPARTDQLRHRGGARPAEHLLERDCHRVATVGGPPDICRSAHRGRAVGRGRPGAYARRMEQSEVLKRVIGILTEAGEMQRHAEEDTSDPDAGGSMVTTLLNETMPHIAIPSDATVEEMAVLVGREVGGAVEQLVGAFTLAFIALAQIHDSGQSDVTSADVLQDLALRAEELSSGDEGSDGPEGPLQD